MVLKNFRPKLSLFFLIFLQNELLKILNKKSRFIWKIEKRRLHLQPIPKESRAHSSVG